MRWPIWRIDWHCTAAQGGNKDRRSVSIWILDGSLLSLDLNAVAVVISIESHKVLNQVVVKITPKPRHEGRSKDTTENHHPF